jgi:hypothetical protein
LGYRGGRVTGIPKDPVGNDRQSAIDRHSRLHAGSPHVACRLGQSPLYLAASPQRRTRVVRALRLAV